MKSKEELMLKELEKKALKNGWIQGKHIFNYLSEIEMHQYDVIKGQIIRNKALDDFVEKCEKYASLNHGIGLISVKYIAKELKKNEN